jgi:ADP-ribosylglycohydrolase
MIGAIVGDIVGSVYEWDNVKSEDFDFMPDRCFFTDDTVMTCAVAEALLDARKGEGELSELLVRSMQRLGRAYPDAGYGGKFRWWLIAEDPQPYNSFGNGSAMRVSPVVWVAASLEEVECLAEATAAVTHNHPEGIKGAQATAGAAWLARGGAAKDEIREYVESRYGYDLSRTLSEIRPTYEFNETCQGSVPEAIVAFLESDGFEDAIRKAVSIGGDSDTIAAITGCIAQAAYGVPEQIESRAKSFLTSELRSIVDRFERETK